MCVQVKMALTDINHIELHCIGQVKDLAKFAPFTQIFDIMNIHQTPLNHILKKKNVKEMVTLILIRGKVVVWN